GPHAGAARHHPPHETGRRPLVPHRHRARRVVPRQPVPGRVPEAPRIRRMRLRRLLARGIAVALAAILLTAAPGQAEPVADFYRGKTLRMLIGYGPGGGYDIYGRLVAEFLPRHLPGNPTIIAQNMPGAGSFVAAKYMYEAAPKDG